MNTLFQYLCPGCGSHLATNDERKIMVCKSCGSIYDYDYFREDKLLDMADLSRKHGEYESAAEMYSFMLDKEPDNFRALNGLMLCNNKINALSDVTTLLNKGTFSTKEMTFERFKANCQEENKAYFEAAEDILVNARKHAELSNEIASKSAEARKLQTKIQGNKDASERQYLRNKNGGYYHPKHLFYITLVGLVFFIAYFITVFAKSGGEGIASSIGFMILFLLLILVPMGYSIGAMKSIKDLLSLNPALNEEVDKILDEKKAMEEEREKIYDKIKYAIQDARKLTPKDN